jgi:hypothetical protein
VFFPDRYKLVAVFRGLLVKVGLDPFLTQRIAVSPKRGIVLYLVFHHRLEDDRDLVRRSCGCRRGTKFGLHTPEVIAKRTLLMMQRVCCQAEQRSGAVLGPSHASPQHFASADVVVFGSVRQALARERIDDTEAPLVGPPLQIVGPTERAREGGLGYISFHKQRQKGVPICSDGLLQIRRALRPPAALPERGKCCA